MLKQISPPVSSSPDLYILKKSRASDDRHELLSLTLTNVSVDVGKDFALTCCLTGAGIQENPYHTSAYLGWWALPGAITRAIDLQLPDVFLDKRHLCPSLGLVLKLLLPNQSFRHGLNTCTAALVYSTWNTLLWAQIRMQLKWYSTSPQTNRCLHPEVSYGCCIHGSIILSLWLFFGTSQSGRNRTTFFFFVGLVISENSITRYNSATIPL